MAQEIILAPMGVNGNRLGILSIRQKDYINRNYKYETPGFMASSLGCSHLLVINYCEKNNLKTPLNSVKKPKSTQKCNFFDVDKYSKITSTI